MEKIHLLGLLCAIMLLSGCKDKTQYCPAYPQDDTDYLPVDFVGQTLRYVFDGDTVTLNVYPPEFSEKYEKPTGTEGMCDIDAQLSLVSAEGASLKYRKKLMEENTTNVEMSMNCFNKEWIWGTFFRTYETSGRLPQWISPNGETYTDVWQSIGGVYKKDTAYFSPQYGLLFYHSAEHRALLLPQLLMDNHISRLVATANEFDFKPGFTIEGGSDVTFKVK